MQALASTSPRNPFPVYGGNENQNLLGWRWLDETGRASSKLYPSQAAAVKELMKYIHYLEHGPTLGQRLWWPVRYTFWPKVLEFIRA